MSIYTEEESLLSAYFRSMWEIDQEKLDEAYKKDMEASVLGGARFIQPFQLGYRVTK